MPSGDGKRVEASPAGDWIELGYVNGVFGIRGWIKVFSFTRPRDAILDYPAWYLARGSDRVMHQVSDGRLQSGGIVARLSGIDDRNAAEMLVGARVEIPASMLGEPRKDEYFWRDLIGLEVINTRGETLGRVDELMETGANDVLVVKGEETVLVPFTRDAVVEVDVSEGRIVVDWERDY